MKAMKKEVYQMDRFTAKPKWWKALKHKQRLSHSEYMVLDTIYDKTIDWGKLTDKIAISQFVDELGLSNRGVIDAIRALKKKGLIFVLGQDRKTNTITIKMDKCEALAASELVRNSHKQKTPTCENFSQTCEKNSYQLVRNSHTHDTRYHYTIPYMSIFLKTQKENPCKAFSKKEKVLNIPFDTFWDLYDHKSTNKKTAQAKWKNLTNQQRQAVIDHLPAYIQSTPDKQYRKHPTTYLNQEHWNTPIAKPTATKIDRTTDKLAVNQNWAGANKSNIVESNITLEEMMGSW